MNKAFFLDRDGTIINDVPYIHNSNDVELIDGVLEAIKLIHEYGYKVVVITNQGGIAKHIVTLTEYQNINNKIQRSLYDGYKIDSFFHCPHHPTISKCICRKPNSFLIEQAAKQFDIDVNQSYMIGDKLSDVQCGINAKCKKSVLILTGHGQEYKAQITNLHGSVAVYNNLYEAVKGILLNDE